MSEEGRVFCLEYAATPPSYNTYRHAHWRKVARIKRDWQAIFEGLLMEAKVPRRTFERCEVAAWLRFPTERRRDAGNFQTTIEKSLADALVNGGWLPDDTFSHFQFSAVEVLPKGDPLMRVAMRFWPGVRELGEAAA